MPKVRARALVCEGRGGQVKLPEEYCTACGVQADKCEAKGGTFLIAANGGVCVKLERVR